MTARKYICPDCRQKTGVNILYGEPTEYGFELAERGEVVLGGCCHPVGGAERECTACGYQWRVQHKTVKGE